MSLWRTSRSTRSALCLALGSGALGCDGRHGLDPELPIGVGSGQTGSPESGGYECLEDSDCKAAAEARAAELTNPSMLMRSFTGARCTQTSVMAGTESRSGPACECATGDGGAITVGPRGSACQVHGRAGSCLWPSFDGCDLNDDSSCNAVCSELEQRFADDAARRFDAQVLYFDCARQSCRSVLSVEGRCTPAAAIGSGKSYDCTLGGKAILDAYEAGEGAAMSEPSAAWSRPSPYVPGTRGFVELSVQSESWGGAASVPRASAWAQFCNIEGESSLHGEVLDPLEGSDDCGVVRRAVWSNGSQTFFEIAEAKLTLSGQSFRFAPSPANNPYYSSYAAPDAFSAAGPQYGATYRFSAQGGGLSAPLDVPVRLPEALEVPVLSGRTRLDNQALDLRWTGSGAAPLRVSLSIAPTLSDSPELVEVECRLQDDGEFELPAAVLAKAGPGLVTATFTREARSVETSGKQQLLCLGKVQAVYHFALGAACAQQAVLDTCQRFAVHQEASYRACGVTPLPALESTCPAYLAESCAGCADYFDCRIQALRCEADGLISNSGCSCPVAD